MEGTGPDHESVENTVFQNNDIDTNSTLKKTNEDDGRLNEKLNEMSTQLINSINKQTTLETQLVDMRKQLLIYQERETLFNSQVVELKDFNEQVSRQNKQIEELTNELNKEKLYRERADQEAMGLREEIGVLSTSLFEEANRMVAIEKEKVFEQDQEIKKLQGVLQEKDDILVSLEMQLKNLKCLLENDSQSLVLTNTNSPLVSANGDKLNIPETPLSGHNSFPEKCDIVFSPSIKSIRYDTEMYNEFLKFIAVLPNCDSITATKTDSKLLKKLVKDEIEPALKIDSAKGILWAAKSKILPAMIGGQVVIEPFSGINETYRYGGSNHDLKNGSSSKDSKLFKFPLDSPPVAVDEPCAFCNESRSDILEHSRLYCLKIFSSKSSSVVSKQYPLCHYCLLKIRQSCEIFAFLRSLKDGVWNLEPVTLKNISKGETYFSSSSTSVGSDSASSSTSSINNTATSKYIRQEKRNKRRSFIESFNSLSAVPVFEPQVHVDQEILDTNTSIDGYSLLPNSNIQRAWIQLCKLRAALYWTELGIWSVDDCISSKIVPFTKTTLNNLKSASHSSLSKTTSLHNPIPEALSVTEGSEIVTDMNSTENTNQEVIIEKEFVNKDEVFDSVPQTPGTEHFDFENSFGETPNSNDAALSSEKMETQSTQLNETGETDTNKIESKSSEEDLFFDTDDQGQEVVEPAKGDLAGKSTRSSQHMSDLYKNLDDLAQDVEAAL